jgi:hypothetical protein
MGKVIGRLGALVSIIVLALPVAASAVKHVAIRDLPKESHSLVGQRISTRGCLIFNIHGTFIEPCGNKDWRAIILVSDPTYKVIPAAFKKLGINYGSQVEGDFSGVLTEKISDGSRPHKIVVLILDSVTNTRRHEP